MELATATITADDTWTTPARNEGYFNLSIQGTFVATVTVQRTYDGSTWYDVDTFTSPTEEVGFDPEDRLYRIGVKSGEFTSGTINIRFGGEDHEVH